MSSKIRKYDVGVCSDANVGGFYYALIPRKELHTQARFVRNGLISARLLPDCYHNRARASARPVRRPVPDIGVVSESLRDRPRACRISQS